MPTEILLGVAKADLDGPATGIAAGDVRCGGGEVGAEEEVVAFEVLRSRTMTRRTNALGLTVYQSTLRV